MGSMSVSERQSTTTASPSMQFRDQRLHKCTPKFAGPTSSAYSLDVAKNTLQNMGYSGLTSMESGDQEMADETPLHTPPMSKAVLPAHLWGREGRDVLGAVGYEEAARLVGVFEKEIWVMYPFLDLDVVQSTCQAWYQTQSQPENNGRNGQQQQQGGGVEDIPEDDLNILKMVIAIATVVEGSGRSDFGERLYDTIKKSADEVMHREGVSIRDIPIMALIATYHFHCDEEALAWRTITVASRLCIELGLHRSDSLYKNFPDPAVRASALRLFWSIYCLDRRWSFGTGMPFAMQDADIDPALPEPEVRGGLPYLGCMIEYSRIGGRVWKSVAGLGETGEAGEGMKGEEVGYLDYKVLQWAKSLPEPLKFHPERPPTNNRAVHRLQTILYLRTNQMRILIYRPVLHSASSILSNLNYAHTVVDLSKDTIRTLAHLNSTTDIYRAQQVCFNYFLISALAVLFLASCHAPVQFSGKCKEEFYMALELVRGFSSKSYVSKRLWRTIKGLKEVGPKLGLDLENSSRTVSNPGGAGGNEDHNAALAMAGLASGGNNNQMEMGYGNSPPINGFVMSNEMTNLFEAALGAGTGLQGGYSPAPEDGGGMGIMGIQGQMGWQGGGNDDELYRQLRDLF